MEFCQLCRQRCSQYQPPGEQGAESTEMDEINDDDDR